MAIFQLSADGRRLAKAALIGLAMAALAGCATEAPYMPPNDVAIDKLPGDRLIVLGLRVGPIRLGESIDDAKGLLGPGTKVTWNTSPGSPNNHFYKGRSWPQYGLAAYYIPSDAYGSIEFIMVSSPKWTTPNGVHFGMPFNEALALVTPQYPPNCGDLADGEHYCLAMAIGGLMIQADSYSNGRTAPIRWLRVDAPGFTM